MIDYLNTNGPAFTFLASLLLAVITAVYVLFTWRMAKSQADANRLNSEPIVVPELVERDSRLFLKVSNAGNTVATGLFVTPRSGTEGLVIDGALVRAALAPRETTEFELLDAKEAARRHFEKLPKEWAEDLKPSEPVTYEPSGKFELLYSDGLDQTMIRTSLEIVEARHPMTDEAQGWLLMTPILRERHSRKKLLKQANGGHRNPELRQYNENSPCSDLWVGGYLPSFGC